MGNVAKALASASVLREQCLMYQLSLGISCDRCFNALFALFPPPKTTKGIHDPLCKATASFLAALLVAFPYLAAPAVSPPRAAQVQRRK